MISQKHAMVSDCKDNIRTLLHTPTLHFTEPAVKMIMHEITFIYDTQLKCKGYTDRIYHLGTATYTDHDKYKGVIGHLQLKV